MFCSSSITWHLLRGLASVAFVTLALLAATWPAPLRMAAGIGALLLLRGCPACWLLGLAQAWAARRRPPAG